MYPELSMLPVPCICWLKVGKWQFIDFMGKSKIVFYPISLNLLRIWKEGELERKEKVASGGRWNK